MTSEQKGYFYSGTIVGVFMICILTIICAFIAEWKDPVSMYHPNKLLNSNEYKIDTMFTICNSDTVVTYKFVKQ